jgi:DNA-directed RNA polymerase alpha subunit
MRATYGIVICSRALRAIELRVAGATFEDVAAELRVTRLRAQQICQRAPQIFGALMRRMAILEAKVETLEKALHERRYLRKKLLLEPIVDEDPVTILSITSRAQNVLRRAGILSIGQLCARGPDELLALGRCGQGSVESIQSALRQIDRHLRGWRPSDPQNLRLWQLNRARTKVPN